MKYEEKLNLIIEAVIEARKATVQGQSTKLYIKEENGLSTIGKEEVRDILYKLQQEDKILSLNDVINRLLPLSEQPKDKTYLLLEIRAGFDGWYSDYLLKKRSTLANIDYINLLKVYDVVLDIEQQLQISDSTTVSIPSLPQLVRFQVLFPIDSVGNRKIYQQYRWEGLKYLHQRKLISEPKYMEDYIGYGSIKTTVELIGFSDFQKEIETEYVKRNKKEEETIDEAREAKTQTPLISYDTSKAILKVNNKTMQFQQKDSFRVKLLELLIKDEKAMKKEWSWDEVIEKIEGIRDTEGLGENKKKFYPACDGLAKSIAQKTGINDLILFSKSTVRINPIYLGK